MGPPPAQTDDPQRGSGILHGLIDSSKLEILTLGQYPNPSLEAYSEVPRAKDGDANPIAAIEPGPTTKQRRAITDLVFHRAARSDTRGDAARMTGGQLS